MKYIEFDTGRVYDSKQILGISIEEAGFDEWGIGVITATFNDPSRHISGRVVNYPVFNGNFGEAVLSAYDHGYYESI